MGEDPLLYTLKPFVWKVLQVVTSIITFPELTHTYDDVASRLQSRKKGAAQGVHLTFRLVHLLATYHALWLAGRSVLPLARLRKPPVSYKVRPNAIDADQMFHEGNRETALVCSLVIVFPCLCCVTLALLDLLLWGC